METLAEQKAQLRKTLREKLSRLKPEERQVRSQEILRRLFQHPRFLEARILLTYIATASEVETRPILQEAQKGGKRVFAPRVNSDKREFQAIEWREEGELQPGPYGILEPPFEPSRLGARGDLDLIVVPGLGFDREGGRLGRGAGYFDPFLAQAKKAYKIGLAFEFQIVDQIPRSSQDVILDEVLIG